jgi:hypothetical protein
MGAGASSAPAGMRHSPPTPVETQMQRQTLSIVADSQLDSSTTTRSRRSPEPATCRPRQEFSPGDHLAIKHPLAGFQGAYAHHGIYVGPDTVIHFSNMNGAQCFPANNGLALARVKRAPLAFFCNGFPPEAVYVSMRSARQCSQRST